MHSLGLKLDHNEAPWLPQTVPGSRLSPNLHSLPFSPTLSPEPNATRD